MKKYQYLLIATALVLLTTGCKKDKEDGVPMTFTAIIASSSPNQGAKVHLDEVSAGLRPGWDASDKINVNGAECTVTAENISTDNASRARFTGSITNCSDGPYYAIYPYEGSTITMSSTGDNVSATVFMPRVQIYDEVNGKQVINAPMAAYNPINPILQFRNLCGLMEIEVTNDKAWDMIIDSVQIEASNFQLSGEMNVGVTDFAYSENNDYNDYNPRIVAANTGKSIVSLARAKTSTDEFNSLNIFVKSNKWSISNTTYESTAKLYAYIPTIAQGSTNAFTVRVFTHPVWDKATNASTFGDPEVHIVYTKQQSSTTGGYIRNSEVWKVSVKPDDDCFPFGTTITSMKEFSTERYSSGTHTPYSICFSRGNVQYLCSGNGDGNGLGRKRFAPRQWVFVNKSSMGNNNTDYSGWIDHFCWATGENFQEHVNNTEGHYDNNNHHLYDANWAPTSKDWGYNFNGNIWHTPSRSEYSGLFPWVSDPLLLTPDGSQARTDEDASDRFAWVALTDVVDETGSSVGENLYGIVISPDVVMNNNPPTGFHTESGFLQLFPNNQNFQFKYRGTDGHKLYNDNILTIKQFEYFEAKGCIFLPCLGVYMGSSTGSGNDLWNQNIGITEGPEGDYWSSTFDDWNAIAVLKLKAAGKNATLNPKHLYTFVWSYSDLPGDRKASVRLVCPYGTPYKFDQDKM